MILEPRRLLISMYRFADRLNPLRLELILYGSNLFLFVPNNPFTPLMLCWRKPLSLSPVKSQMVEFKIGISHFTSGKVNTKVIEKIGQLGVYLAARFFFF